ncbi:MAG: ATP synthase subunit a 1 [Candidatus Dojkabacteria bacterium]|nr:MAG: ATP synthase subunit a 1 [Candidatus Dojkabacteria bacterium]
MDWFRVDFGEIKLSDHILGEFFGIPISSDVLTSFLVTILVGIFCLLISRKIKVNGVPSKTQIVLESIYLYAYDLIEKISGDKTIAQKTKGTIMSIMAFIAISNAILIIPGLSSITYEGEPIFITNVTTLNTTLALATVAVLWTQFLSISKFSLWGHFNKYFRIKAVVDGFRKGFVEGLMSFVEILLGFLDIVSEIARILSLSLRLFGNMFAGDILMRLLVSFFAIILPVFLNLYGIFTGILQAIVFGALVASYFGSALKE